MAGVFTSNKIPAAPVILDRLHLKTRRGRAIIINSGNANACTGHQGLHDAEEMARLVANRLQVDATSVFVGSTGVIGPKLPMHAIRQSIPLLMQNLKKSGHRDAARAIMTTDTTIKEIAVQTQIGKQRVKIGGMAKGSGMIHPDMATMLAYVTTDVVIHPTTLQTFLQKSVDRSFNAISVDGETSTNDTVLCLANGLANNSMIDGSSTGAKKFLDALNDLCDSLARKICQDGEGATKIVELVVGGARNHREAKIIANTLATSPLIKTALFGEDPNWGRFIAAIGRSSVPIQPHHIGLSFGGIPIVRNGEEVLPSTERQIQRVMRRKHYTITVKVGNGKGWAKIWTTDFSYDYVKINASYRS